MNDSDLLLIGKVSGVHGLTGNLKVISYAESISVFEPGLALILQSKDGPAKPYFLNWAKPHKKNLLLSIKGVDDRDKAEALRGSALFIDRNILPELDEDAYYWEDLIGLAVFDTEGIRLGKIVSIFQTGSNDVYVVKSQKDELLIPAIASVVTRIDLKMKQMIVDLPDGLLGD